MPEFIANNLPSIVLLLIASILGAIAYRRNNLKQLREIQTQVTATYKILIEAQEQELKRLRKENIAMRAAFKQLGIEIEITGNEITLIRSESPKRTRITQVHIDEDVKENTSKEE